MIHKWLRYQSADSKSIPSYNFGRIQTVISLSGRRIRANLHSKNKQANRNEHNPVICAWISINNNHCAIFSKNRNLGCSRNWSIIKTIWFNIKSQWNCVQTDFSFIFSQNFSTDPQTKWIILNDIFCSNWSEKVRGSRNNNFTDLGCCRSYNSIVERHSFQIDWFFRVISKFQTMDSFFFRKIEIFFCGIETIGDCSKRFNVRLLKNIYRLALLIKSASVLYNEPEWNCWVLPRQVEIFSILNIYNKASVYAHSDHNKK